MLQNILQSIDHTSEAPAAVAATPLTEASESLLVPRTAIEQAVVQVFGVGHDELHGMTRGRAKIAFARQVAMYLAHVACRLSLTDTGRLFGRDRTTVAHACTVIEDRRDDPVFDRALDLLEWAVRSFAIRSAGSRSLSS
jgi:chromosomal replication initiation ATPase DnaA